MNSLLIIATPLVACVICAMLIVLLRPQLQRYALARPNARSSHSVPTPQGGGVAVIAAVITSVAISVSFFGAVAGSVLLAVLAAAVLLALVGAYDDLRTIPVLPRLLIQAAAVGIVLATLPAEFHLVQVLPVWAERVLLLISGLWFVNLVNFMDGLDWITAAEVVPVMAALALFGFYGQLPLGPTLVALALCGAMIGFAPFNKPVAKLFLGDVGSLPIGLLMGWCLLQLAGSGHLIAALLLPLYYLADATLTLLKRLMRGETVWVAHRSHFYQQATNNGFSVMQVVGEVFILNIVLAAFAAVTIWQKSPYVQGIALALGISAVALVLGRFSRKRDPLGGSKPPRS
ncbi:glycosyltransferase family 4 protein [Afipia massiliensis]|uniref:Glycosyltransferase family 4 protein n=1 Tax=Afipia massiliensis TaxID=211460 RepID=A0A4U6BS45_9BRAD|nr:glycosyltransferase family 4 protein [Afipia massiliensis]TKT72395.1 glycosyltransferase family 4 protein [Afipia massiliensis]